jgi:hypothetical protein
MMKDKDPNRPGCENDDDTLPLEYESPRKLIKRGGATFFGIISLVILALLMPWAVFCFFTAWGSHSFNRLPEKSRNLVLWGGMGLPLPLSFGFGCYCIKISKTVWQRMLGLIGVTTSAVITILGMIFLWIVA